MARARIGELVESDRFQMFIVCVIVVNAITLGAETSTVLHANFGPMLTVVDHLALALFTLELGARLYALGCTRSAGTSSRTRGTSSTS